MQVISIVIATLFGLWFSGSALSAATSTTAHVAFAVSETGQWPVAVVPAGSANGVTLRAQTVDVTIGEDSSGIYADTQVWVRLSNPTTQTVSLTVALPGPAMQSFTPYISPTLPTDLKLALDDEPLAADPAPAPNSSAPAGLTASITVPANSQVGLRASYRQALPQHNGLALFAYPLTASARWGNTPESLRVTVKFAAPMPAEEILGQFPDGSEYDGQSLTWQLAGTKANANVWAAFMTPSWWATLSAARSKAAASGATPADQVALSRLYQQMAGLPPTPFAPDADFYDRYYPAAVAALQAAAREPAAQGASAEQEKLSPDVVTAHAMLADLYHQQAARLDPNAGIVYLKLAANEAQAALDGGATDPNLRKLAADAYLELATRARVNGDAKGAEDYLAQLAVVQTPEHAAAAAAQQAATRLQTASRQLDAGQLEDARRIISDTFGLTAIEPPGLRPPIAGQLFLSVDTGPAHRTIRLTLAGYHDPAAAAALVSDAAGVLNGVDDVSATFGPDWLALDIPYRDLAGLSAAQHDLVAALPGAPEMALLEGALTADHASLLLDETTFQRTWRFAEEVDLHATQQAWENLAARLEATAKAPQTATPQTVSATVTGDSAAQLAHIQQALWTADAAAWRGLTASSRAEYRLDIPRAGAPRAWVMPAGSARTMTTENRLWRYDRFLLVGGGIVLLAIILSFIIWRWG
jgi:hypothetical protein